MQELVKYETDQGQQIQITPDDVRRYICESATDKEVGMFLQLCKAQRLNPFIRDAYLIKYGSSPATIVTGKEVFTKRAAANPDYEGFEAGVIFIDKEGNVKQREGSGTYKAAGEQLVGGWARVFVKGRKPVYDEVTLEEYSTGKSGWAKMPATMIRKVALVHCLREAFPSDFQGLYAQEEMGKVSEAELTEAPIERDTVIVEAEAVTMITDDQRAEMAGKVSELAAMRSKEEADVMQAVISSATLYNAGYVEGEQFTEQQAALAITLLDNWLEKAHAANIAAAEAAKEQVAQQQEAQEAQVVEMAEEDIPF